MEYYRNVRLSPEMEEAAAKVQAEVSAAYEEAERALEMMRHEGETEELGNWRRSKTKSAVETRGRIQFAPESMLGSNPF